VPCPVCNKGITQFYLPPTHEPLLPSRKASPPDLNQSIDRSWRKWAIHVH